VKGEKKHLTGARLLARGGWWLGGLFTLHVSLFTLCLNAQIPEESDTLPSDSIPRDTVDYTARFLKEQQNVAVRVATLPYAGVRGPRPALTRIVFTRDSIEWGEAATVSDLLSQVPGVFLWRGGFIGRPEPGNFEGRGATSIEYYLDGLPYVAAGVDSIAVDPALFSISFLDRIEVERWPGLLRVELFTRRHDRLAPRSRIGIARGDRDFARYEADLERRFPSGIGFAGTADYLNSPTASGSGSKYTNTQVWVQGGWVPSDRFGLQYQLVHSSPNRNPFVVSDPVPNDTIGLGFKATRSDAQFRLAWRPRGGVGMGPGIDLVYGRTGWDGAGIKQQINQLGGYASWRTPTFSIGGSALHRTRWTSLDLRGNAGWTPIAQFAATAEVVHQRHDGARSSDYLSLAAGLRPVRGFAVTGSLRRGNIVAAPAIASDTSQELRDYGATVSWDRERIGLQVGVSHTSAFSPFSFAEFPRVPLLAASPEIDWLTIGARIAPLRWITLQSWYSDPRKGSADGIPPTHSVSTATIRSKFLRSFPSGTFDLKLSLSMEAWGQGTIGRDAGGAPINLRGATFFRSLLQIQLQSFIIYWDRGNLSATKLTYVPGFRIPAYGSNFGVRWEFLN
jgi:hypothetical protein